MPVLYLPPLFAAISLILIGIFLALMTISKRKGTLEKRTVALRIIFCIGCLSAIVFISSCVLLVSANQHGAYDLTEDTVSDTIEHIRLSPEDQSSALPDSPRNCFVYLFRYSCPDCEDVHDDVLAWAQKQTVPVYNVSSRSDRGIALRDELSIREVPSVIAYDSAGNPSAKRVYKQNDDGTAVLQHDVLDKLERIVYDD